MKKLMFLVLVVSGFFVFVNNVLCQVKVVDFNQLSPYLNRDSDTTYIINFWATWCAPCISELPEIDALGMTYHSQKVKVILVSLDFPNNLNTRLIPFIQKNKISSEVILLDDPESSSWINEVSPDWSGGIPATLIYNTKRNVRIFYEQPFTFQELEEVLKDHGLIHLN